MRPRRIPRVGVLRVGVSDCYYWISGYTWIFPSNFFFFFFFFIFPLVIFDPMFDFHLMSDECNGG